MQPDSRNSAHSLINTVEVMISKLVSMSLSPPFNPLLSFHLRDVMLSV